MTFEESLKLERYRLVTERQKYFTDLAKETFGAYARTFAAFAAGAVALVSLKLQLGLEVEVVTGLVRMIAILLTFAAVISIAQIIFCLLRWYGFRYAECEINPKSPKPEPWAWLFEGMYAFGILVSIGVAWWGVDYIAVVLNTL